MASVSAKDVERAIRRYEAGDRPFRHTPPRAWYLVAAGRRLYPLKYVYALAIGKRPGTFHTADAVRDVKRLHFDVKREPRDTETEFQRRVAKALKNDTARRTRLAKARAVPRTVIREIIVYERNPDVVAEVLVRAKGRCERCRKKAPFVKRIDSVPYLEVHHTKRLADGGEDCVANAIAVCPNCHRELHHG